MQQGLMVSPNATPSCNACCAYWSKAEITPLRYTSISSRVGHWLGGPYGVANGNGCCGYHADRLRHNRRRDLISSSTADISISHPISDNILSGISLGSGFNHINIVGTFYIDGAYACRRRSTELHHLYLVEIYSLSVVERFGVHPY
jgi:hypothetical protein